MAFDGTQAHSALYDTEQTAQLFCEIVNRWKRLGGWPLPVATRSDKKSDFQEVAFLLMAGITLLSARRFCTSPPSL
jgi:DNA polymerase III epsilon subunit-like protein